MPSAITAALSGRRKWPMSMEQFDVAGISQTHDEMVRKIEETDRGQRGSHGDGLGQRGSAEA